MAKAAPGVFIQPAAAEYKQKKTVCKAVRLPLIRVDKVFADADGAFQKICKQLLRFGKKNTPTIAVEVNFLRRRPCGIHGFGLDMLFSGIGYTLYTPILCQGIFFF